ncbi:hypothetical protein ACFVW1_14515 [Streptomyces olivochromogenes]|uniref:hypothetical protein n=1 Tax=Streptomyces olivochromogenes TaxID=1963 RepID=UPI0036DBA8ED
MRGRLREQLAWYRAQSLRGRGQYQRRTLVSALALVAAMASAVAAEAWRMDSPVGLTGAAAGLAFAGLMSWQARDLRRVTVAFSLVAEELATLAGVLERTSTKDSWAQHAKLTEDVICPTFGPWSIAGLYSTTALSLGTVRHRRARAASPR